MPFYDTHDYTKSVDGMKIVPLQTSELITVIMLGLHYNELYRIFNNAFDADNPPHQWYDLNIKKPLTSKE